MIAALFAVNGDRLSQNHHFTATLPINYRDIKILFNVNVSYALQIYFVIALSTTTTASSLLIDLTLATPEEDSRQ